MIREQDAYGRWEEEAETPEEYLLLEIKRLKKENDRLKKELEAEKENKIVRFVIGFNKQEETEYKVRLNDKAIKIEAWEDKNE